MNIKQQLLRVGATWAALAVFMALFQPDKLPVVVLIVPFILLFAALYSLWNLLFMLRARFSAKTGEFRPRKRLGMTVCLSAVLLLVLQSLGQLTLRDVVTVVAIVVLGYLYLGRSRFSAPKR